MRNTYIYPMAKAVKRKKRGLSEKEMIENCIGYYFSEVEFYNEEIRKARLEVQKLIDQQNKVIKKLNAEIKKLHSL